MAARAAKWKPDAEQRNLVASLAAFGMQVDEQVLLVKGPNGRTLGVDEFTEVFAEELSGGRAKANAALGQALYKRALNGDARALREWQKQAVSETVGTREIATWLDCSTTMVSTLERRGVIRKTAHGLYPLRETVIAVVGHYREVAAGRTDSDPQSGGALVTERARLARELADKASMENGRLRGELVPLRDVLAKMVSCNRIVMTRLLSLPAEAAPEIHSCGNVLEVETMMRALISEALERMCNDFEPERRQLH